MSISNKLSRFNKQEIINKYISSNCQYNCAQLAKEYGVSRQGMRLFLKRQGLITKTKRRSNIDESFFDIINNEAKAYYFGLLCADGCNFENRSIISIALQERDGYILEKFREHLNASTKVALYDYRGDHPTWQRHYRFQVWSPNISKQLAQKGCVARKSLILDFPSSSIVPDHLLHHFIRGYFDGDGSVTIYNTIKEKSLKYNLAITSSRQFCEKLSSIISNKLTIFMGVYNENKCSNNTAKSVISGRHQIQIFLDWIYSDATIYLIRKYNQYQKIKYPEHPVISRRSQLLKLA